MPTVAEHLAALRRRLAATAAALHAVADDLTPEQRLWRPAPERWGVADCCEHLLTVNALYVPRVAAALDAAGPPDAAGDARPWRPTWFGRWFVRAAGPGGRATPTFRAFQPPPARADAPERLLAAQAELHALLDRAAGRDLRGPKVHSPVTRLLTLRAGEALELLVVHQDRHVQQADAVRREPGFPRV